MPEQHFTTPLAAEYLGNLGLNFTKTTLDLWRHRGNGPRFKKIAGRVFYRKCDLDDFARGRLIETSDSRPEAETAA